VSDQRDCGGASWIRSINLLLDGLDENRARSHFPALPIVRVS